MRHLALLDFETTGTDEHALPIEIAVVLYSVENACALASRASLFRADENPAEAVNGIPLAALREAPEPAEVWALIRPLLEQADVLCAYGADFDRRFLPTEGLPERPWICAMDDLLWPRAHKPRMSLVALALAHGVAVGSGHRALADCDVLARLFTRVRETEGPLDAMLARGLRPKARFVVADRNFDRARNELAKAAGFQFDWTNKTWWRSMPREDAALLPFAVREDVERTGG